MNCKDCEPLHTHHNIKGMVSPDALKKVMRHISMAVHRRRLPTNDVLLKRLDHLYYLRRHVDLLLDNPNGSLAAEASLRSIRKIIAEDKKLDDMLNSGSPVT